MGEEISIEKHEFPNLGYIVADVPRELLDEIQQRLNNFDSGKTKLKKFNHRLVGQLKEEWELDLSDRAIDLIELICNQWFTEHDMEPDHKIQLMEIWVNRQRKHEFNPIHNHTGVLSFCIWFKIPYELEDELKIYPDSADQHVSMFEFVYTSTVGKITTLPLKIDKSWEGKMAVWPAQMSHLVHPFYTSDDTRISIAGNLG
jgi:hypothetical protein